MPRSEDAVPGGSRFAVQALPTLTETSINSLGAGWV
jgi:hypothetical protein